MKCLHSSAEDRQIHFSYLNFPIWKKSPKHVKEKKDIYKAMFIFTCKLLWLQKWTHISWKCKTKNKFQHLVSHWNLTEERFCQFIINNTYKIFTQFKENRPVIWFTYLVFTSMDMIHIQYLVIPIYTYIIFKVFLKRFVNFLYKCLLL